MEELSSLWNLVDGKEQIDSNNEVAIDIYVGAWIPNLISSADLALDK
jgi:hypothetical protein